MNGADAEQQWRQHAHLLDIERHWTAQVQNQQQRNSTILTVNGVLVGFLGTVGLSETIQQEPRTAHLFAWALVMLAVALVPGLVSLLPRIPIADTASPGALRRLSAKVGSGLSARYPGSGRSPSSARAHHRAPERGAPRGDPLSGIHRQDDRGWGRAEPQLHRGTRQEL